MSKFLTNLQNFKNCLSDHKQKFSTLLENKRQIKTNIYCRFDESNYRANLTSQIQPISTNNFSLVEKILKVQKFPTKVDNKNRFELKSPQNELEEFLEKIKQIKDSRKNKIVDK